MRKAISVILVLMMVCSLLSFTAAGANSVTDNTVEQTLAATSNNLTRADVITALYRSVGSPAVQYGDYYADVPEDQPFTNAVMWAHKAKFILGYNNGYFLPEKEITREEFATMLYGAYTVDISQPMTAQDISYYTDYSDVSAWAEHSLAWCIFREVLARNYGKLDPQTLVTDKDLTDALSKLKTLKNDPRDIWVLNPVPTRAPIEVPGLAKRVTGGWEDKTIVFLANYNGNTTSIGTELTNRMPASTKLIWVGDMTVIAGQTVNPSRAPTVGNWTTLTYAQFQSQLESGQLQPEAIIAGNGF